MIVAMCVMQTLMALGQTPSRDTIPCGERQRNYFYSEWYDTTNYYLRPDCYSFTAPELPGNLVNLNTFGGYEYVAFQQFAPRRIRIKGIWGMVAHYPAYYGNDAVLDTTRLPEYFYLYQRDPEGTPPAGCGWSDKFLVLLDSVRWDTAQPKMMCVKQTADGRKPNKTCHVYEALFDTVYTLSGEFWIGGSGYSCEHVPNVYPRTYYHLPTDYVSYSASAIGQRPSLYRHSVYTSTTSGTPEGPWRWRVMCDGRFALYDGVDFSYGPFGVILDEQQYYVGLPSADTAQGIAKPTAYYPAGSRQTITAVANSCHRFSHWSDGDTSNPRTIMVTQDTVFVAYFDTVPRYEVSARSNNDTLGRAVLREWPIRPPELPHDTTHVDPDSFYFPYYRVIGTDTVYCEGDSAIFWAKPKPGAYFWHWDDSVRDNPRTVLVTRDTRLTAIFKRVVPPEYLRPCPRIGKPRKVVMDTGRVLLTWVWDASTLHEGWEVAWGLAGMPPDSCEVISCGNFDRVFDSLEAGVRYAAYVRALCNGGGREHYSDWSDSVEIYFPYFPHRYTVSVSADYVEHGRVYGGGEYDEGDVAMLTASALRPYSFLQWDDGDTANPRYVVVTQDTTFTAQFSEQEGAEVVGSAGAAFRLLPNPASGSVRCVMNGTTFAGGVLTMADASGREVLREELPPQTACHTLTLAAYPNGVYFVTLTTAKGTSTQKLVIN